MLIYSHVKFWIDNKTQRKAQIKTGKQMHSTKTKPIINTNNITDNVKTQEYP